MKMPEFRGYQQIKQKLTVELGNWVFFMEFRSEVEKYETEEWITFRGNLNKYAELVNDFISKAKQLKNMDQVAHLIKDVL